jgi:hypothetical protein
MIIPIRFRKSSEGAIASYDFVDIAEGTGVSAFYLAQAQTSSAISYILTTNQIYSDIISLLHLGASTQSQDFNLTAFNLPKIVKGTAYASFALAGGGNMTYVKVQLKKVSGVTVSNVSGEISADLTTGAEVKMCLIPMPLTTTHFKIGDILRLTLQMSNSNGNMEIGTDPKGRAGTYITSSTPTITTISQIFVPFRIDI